MTVKRSADADAVASAWPALEPDVAAELSVLLSDKLPLAFTAQRLVELESGFESRAATNNIVDAFSHVGKLFEAADVLTPEEQREQITLIADHLKRAIIEGPEEVMADILAEAVELWDEYVGTVRPLVAAGRLDASKVTPDETLAELRRSFVDDISSAREGKSGPTWDRAFVSAKTFAELAVRAQEFRDELRVVISTAKLATSDEAGT